MRLCTFEVSTHLGRSSRVGVFKDGRIIDVNFATAWYLAQQGEAEPQQLADALAPSKMLDFLRAGLRAIHTAEELFLGAGPNPADWWKSSCAPRGPNDETLAYTLDQVKLQAPLPSPTLLGTDGEIRFADKSKPELKLAAVIGKQGTNIAALEARGHLAGFAGMIDSGARRSALGPTLVTPDEIGNPYALEIVVRINDDEFARTTSAGLRPKFENAVEQLSANDVILPGDVIAFPIDVHPPVQCGDVIEFEIEKIGTLRTRVV